MRRFNELLLESFLKEAVKREASKDVGRLKTWRYSMLTQAIPDGINVHASITEQ